MSKYTTLIESSCNFNHLKKLSESINTSSEEGIRTKFAINWAISTIMDQAKALAKIEEETNIL